MAGPTTCAAITSANGERQGAADSRSKAMAGFRIVDQRNWRARARLSSPTLRAATTMLHTGPGQQAREFRLGVRANQGKSLRGSARCGTVTKDAGIA